jgi:hypothetical protein
MPVSLVISENRCNFMVLNYKVLQTIIAMITGSKVIDLFCMADDLASLIFNSANFDAMMAKYTLKPTVKRKFNYLLVAKI